MCADPAGAHRLLPLPTGEDRLPHAHPDHHTAELAGPACQQSDRRPMRATTLSTTYGRPACSAATHGCDRLEVACACAIEVGDPELIAPS